jgi:DNA-binding CsgD family transcriptional regulator
METGMSIDNDDIVFTFPQWEAIDDAAAEMESLIENIRDWIADPFVDVALTDREHEIIIPAARGVPASIIADRLKINRQGAYEAIRRALSKINATRGSDLSLKNLSEETYKQLERILK